MNKNILVTGGCGYIGTNTIVFLLKNNFNVIVIDNLSNSTQTNLQKITRKLGKEVKFYFGDIGDRNLLARVFSENNIFAVLHLAAFKSVGESMKQPEKYFKNNVENFKILLNIMNKYGVKKIVFPSSVTTYKYNDSLMPYSEDAQQEAKSPYAQTKMDCEAILESLYKFDKNWHIVIFRYANPISANLEFDIGDDPTTNKTNLVPYISSNCEVKGFHFVFHGKNYQTLDGTGERDEVHILDLAKANLLALNCIQDIHLTKLNVSGNAGYTVLQIVQEFENACGHEIDYEFSDERAGDVPKIVANNNKIYDEINWTPEHNFVEMIEDEYAYRNKKNK